MNIVDYIKNYYIIKKSSFFDMNWFKKEYDLENIDFIKYYLQHGIELGLNPSPNFDTLWYLNEHVDVKNSGMHPFVHYIRHGFQEHRLTQPLITKISNKFSLANIDYNPCFFKLDKTNIEKNAVNIAIFIKNDVSNMLPTEYVRLIVPFYHLFLQNNFNPYIFNNDDVLGVDLSLFDIIIVQRDAIDKSSANFIVNFCKNNNIKLIYEIDDDLLGIDEFHPNYNEFYKKKEVFTYLISNANAVTVSTDVLKEKFSNLNNNIKVIKNSLNDMLNLENSFNQDSDIIKIGYMGTFTHKNDVKIIEKAIENVKEYFSKKGKIVKFEIVGVSEEKINCANSINIPFNYSKYPYFIRWLKKIIDWDIAIAPLQYTQFNQSKSEIKYLEYSSLGIPGIYSDVGAYSFAIDNTINGMLVFSNSVEEWQSSIIELIENKKLREDIIKNSSEDIRNNYSIDSMVDSWCQLLENLLSEEKLKLFNNQPLKLLTNPLFNQDYEVISQSNLFDENYYCNHNPSAIYHFLTNGVFEGFNPSNEFNCNYYIKKNNIDLDIINPFVHFIKKFNYKFNYSYLNYETVESVCQNLKNKVSIIIPIYNAYTHTKKCLESVLEFSTNGHELILINDKSTDKRINDLLREYDNNSHIKIFNNEENLGFVASVNIGLKNSSNDVILLNSDTIVTPRWIEKLTIAAYSNDKIATVTPFSNNAGVFSVPKMDQKNTIPKNLSLNNVAKIVEKESNHNYVQVPTGNGFCMYIKRKTIDSIGYFDENTFKRGYGEENDFCMRAINDGWVNIIDDATYIFHEDNSSFGAEKQKLIDEHMNLLKVKHPNYDEEVKKFINSIELKGIRCNIEKSLKKGIFPKKSILHISNSKNVSSYDDYENYLLYVNNKISLYYVDNYLFKIKEWSSENVDEICFNVIINLGIDELLLCMENVFLEKSKFLMECLK